MTQYFDIMSVSHLNSDPNKAFVWSEDDDGYEKYGFINNSSIFACLTQIESEIQEEEFEINVAVKPEDGGTFLIKSLEELASAKLKYKSFLIDN